MIALCFWRRHHAGEKSTSAHAAPRDAMFTAVALVLISAGCAKSTPASAELGGPASSGTALVAASAAGAPSAVAATAPKAGAAHWVGSYVAKVGAVDPPKAANEKTWASDPGTSSTGKGTIDLVVGQPPGEARGHLKGALGELELTGTFDGHELNAELRPEQPNSDSALTGIASMKVEGGAMKGTARVSGRDGKIVRQADLELAPR